MDQHYGQTKVHSAPTYNVYINSGSKWTKTYQISMKAVQYLSRL